MKLAVHLTFLIASTMTMTAQANDYGAWRKKNTDGSWTRFTEEAVKSSSLPKAVPADIDKFCPGYKSQNEADRITFWAGLISAIARPESNFKPETTYTEIFSDGQGNKVVSRGLLQISIESANQARYACAIQKPEDLHDPKVNLACGVKILDYWIKKDNVLATYRGQKPVGGGRYWSTLRETTDPKKNHLPELTGFTRSLAVCTQQLTLPSNTINLLESSLQENGLPDGWMTAADNFNCTVKFQDGAIYFERLSRDEKCSFAFHRNLSNGDYLLKTQFKIDGNEPQIFLDGKPLNQETEIKVINGTLSVGIQTRGAGKVWGNISSMILSPNKRGNRGKTTVSP
jgi:hypothetical protein